MRYVATLIGLSSCAVDLAPDPTAVESQALDERPPAHVLVRGRPSGGAASNLIDHGGRILPASTSYAIWWGNSAAFPSDAQPGIDALFSDLNGTSFLGIAGQYMRGAAIGTAFAANYFDSSPPPNHGPKISTIVDEVCTIIDANGLTADPAAVYFVYTSNFPHVSYCAWHDFGTCNGVTIQVAYMPNLSGIGGCDPLAVVNLGCYSASTSEGLAALANATSHELMEMITDADITAWFDSSGNEIADKCAWRFSSCVTLGGGSSWELQEEWSNAASGCAQG